MVKGLARFRAHFSGYEDAYALIGGAACDQWFALAGGEFRATRDLDIVLLVRATEASFFPRFREFVRAGGYRAGQRAADGRKTFYRFLNPVAKDFPRVIELFSAVSVEEAALSDQRIVPVPTDEGQSSLSAILLDPDYTEFILGQREIADGLPLIKPAGLILLKVRAWLDLSARRSSGAPAVDEKDIAKHRNDIFRLATLLPVGEQVRVQPALTDDLRQFLDSIRADPSVMEAVRQSLASGGLKIPPSALADILRQYYEAAP